MGVAGLGLAVAPAWAATTVKLPLPGGPQDRPITEEFPQKAAMILQRTRPPLLETPFEVFDKGVFTPNDQFFVRWHWAGIPTEIDVDKFRLTVHGQVTRACPFRSRRSCRFRARRWLPSINAPAIRGVCSSPGSPGGQWGNGAMGNARWTGVRLEDVLDRAGVKPGAVAVRFRGLDEAVIDGAPRFLKSLDIDHARDGEVMIAYQMNGEQLPLLNGYPIRLVVPGWYSTYWVKMLSDIEVLDAPDDNFWMKTAYRIPDTPYASVKPDEKGYKTVPINRMLPRSFATNLKDGDKVRPRRAHSRARYRVRRRLRVKKVELSIDGGANWSATELGPDEGAYGFRQWRTQVTAPASGDLDLMLRCTNVAGVSQPLQPNWNPGGFMRNIVEKSVSSSVDRTN